MTSGVMPSSAGRRYGSLDGLRGLAALVVVATHILIVVPAVSDVIWRHEEPSAGTGEWWIFRTPLVALTLGDQAVMIFFVMSGFVLAIPMLRGRQTARGTLAYYGRRLIRLYVPVWASLLLAAALALVFIRDGFGSDWLASHPGPEPRILARDALLLLGTSNLNSPLWSLTWEMWFSLLLPVIIALYRVTRATRWWAVLVPLLVVASVASELPIAAELPLAWLSVPLLRYLPVFVLGIVIADHRARLADAMSRMTSVAWALASAATAVVLIVPPMVLPILDANDVMRSFRWLCEIVAAGAVVLLALYQPRFAGFLETRPMEWTGRRSFSLYLTHEPIIVSAAILVRADGWWPWLAFSVVLIPLVLLVAAVFYRWVEVPSHALARRVGRLIERGAVGTSSVG